MTQDNWPVGAGHPLGLPAQGLLSSGRSAQGLSLTVLGQQERERGSCKASVTWLRTPTESHLPCSAGHSMSKASLDRREWRQRPHFLMGVAVKSCCRRVEGGTRGHFILQSTQRVSSCGGRGGCRRLADGLKLGRADDLHLVTVKSGTSKSTRREKREVD